MEKVTTYSQAGLDQLTKENIEAGKVAFKSNDGSVAPIRLAFGDSFLVGNFGKFYSIEELADLLESGQYGSLVLIDEKQQPKFCSLTILLRLTLFKILPKNIVTLQLFAIFLQKSAYCILR